MPALDHYDYCQLQVAKDGSLVDRDQVTDLRRLADDVTDVLVVSHGWNNDMAEAHALYERLAGSLDAVRSDLDVAGSDRSFAICGVMWPSKRFAERSLISGGAAAAGAVDPHLGKDVLDHRPPPLRRPAQVARQPGGERALGRDGPVLRPRRRRADGAHRVGGLRPDERDPGARARGCFGESWFGARAARRAGLQG